MQKLPSSEAVPNKMVSVTLRIQGTFALSSFWWSQQWIFPSPPVALLRLTASQRPFGMGVLQKAFEEMELHGPLQSLNHSAPYRVEKGVATGLLEIPKQGEE